MEHYSHLVRISDYAEVLDVAGWDAFGPEDVMDHDLWSAFISWTISAHNFAYSITLWALHMEGTIDRHDAKLCDSRLVDFVIHSACGDCVVGMKGSWWASDVAASRGQRTKRGQGVVW